MRDVIADLQQTTHLLQEEYYNLDGFKDLPVQLFKRMHKSVNKGKRITDKFPPQLRCFALTVHFYSPKAYDYVRESFHFALPHPSVIRSWYSTIDAEAGFSEECFNTLRLKSEEHKKQNKRLVCALIMDEMGIKVGSQRGRDGKQRGHVDFGHGDLDEKFKDKLEPAKNSLVLLVVPLNDTWKLPIAYFLINGLTGSAKANLINEALIRLHEVGVEISSLTLDGPPDHFTAVSQLGATMSMNPLAHPQFPHPVAGQPAVNVIIDPCHALKNIRNALDAYSVLFDGEGKKIEWRYIKELALLQQEEGLRLGNKLRTMHIEYKKLIMKVYLAAQTLSASVADAIEYCWETLHLPQFEGCEATVKFIRYVDCIFDFLNVRNPWGKGFKSPLKKDNEHIWRDRILDAIKYLSELKLENGQSIGSCGRKCGFIGFYTAVLSVIAIYDRYVKPDDAVLLFLLTYKLSQDHLELLFAAIRARSGWCPNPTASQFISAYKRLLVRHDVKISSGNTQLLDNTKILHVTVEKKNQIAKIDRYDPKIYSAVENDKIEQKYGLVPNITVQDQNTNVESENKKTNQNEEDQTKKSEKLLKELEELITFAWASPEALSDFSTSAVGYIAGFVVLKLSSSLKCTACVAGCKSIIIPGSTPDYIDVVNGTGLVIKKTRGGLVPASKSVLAICSTAERLLRKACKGNMGYPPVENNFPAVLSNAAHNELVSSGELLFPELQEHFQETLRSDDCLDHMYVLIKHILMRYIDIRINAITKNAALAITGTNKRHFLTRQIVWAHQ